jgi:hypothetical protein
MDKQLQKIKPLKSKEEALHYSLANLRYFARMKEMINIVTEMPHYWL